MVGRLCFLDVGLQAAVIEPITLTIVRYGFLIILEMVVDAGSHEKAVRGGLGLGPGV